MTNNIAATLSILVTIIASAGVITAILVTNSRIGDVRDDLKGFRAEFREDMKLLRADFKEELAKITKELTEIHKEIKTVAERKLVG